jgi:hypothetical protein
MPIVGTALIFFIISPNDDILTCLYKINTMLLLKSSVVDPDPVHLDPHSFGCFGSGFVLGMRIRIQEYGY